jgi:hypothetical protein
MEHAIFERARRGDLAAMRELSTSQLHSLLLGLLTDLAGDAYVDDDTLFVAGVSVANSGHLGADDAVLAWLGEEPTDGRLAVASAFLDGYWMNIRHTPDMSRIEGLLTVATNFTPQAAGWRFATNTALRIYGREDLPERTKSHLHRILLECRDALAVAGGYPRFISHITRNLG